MFEAKKGTVMVPVAEEPESKVNVQDAAVSDTAETTVTQTASVEEVKAETLSATTEVEKTEESVTDDTTGSEPCSEEPATDKAINLSDGEFESKAATSKKTTTPPPIKKAPTVDFDIFIPRVKQLKGKAVESFSDEEIIDLALNKLLCDSYKSLKGVENTPAIACWLHLYNTVEDGDAKLARAICNTKKDFPAAMKFMLDQVRKVGSGGFDHNELFEYIEKYYYSKDKPKKEKSSGKKKESAAIPQPKNAKTEKAADSKKVETKKAKKVKEEKPQAEVIDLFTLLAGGGAI